MDATATFNFAARRISSLEPSCSWHSGGAPAGTPAMNKVRSDGLKQPRTRFSSVGAVDTSGKCKGVNSATAAVKAACANGVTGSPLRPELAPGCSFGAACLWGPGTLHGKRYMFKTPRGCVDPRSTETLTKLSCFSGSFPPPQAKRRVSCTSFCVLNCTSVSPPGTPAPLPCTPSFEDCREAVRADDDSCGVFGPARLAGDACWWPPACLSMSTSSLPTKQHHEKSKAHSPAARAVSSRSSIQTKAKASPNCDSSSGSQNDMGPVSMPGGATMITLLHLPDKASFASDQIPSMNTVLMGKLLG
mmetsp:Transcript_46185/g.84599  ORF Transcript_46185/g.84599 Transcript_46185/m.84599 type:complete len:303 (+) Transcript_46185:1247-2155(+)